MDQFPSESRIIHLEPLMLYKYYKDNYDDYFDEYFVYGIYVNCYFIVPVTATYGKRKITLSFENGKSLTILAPHERTSVSLYAQDGSIVNCENDLQSADVIPPCIINTYRGESGQGIKLNGIWPTLKSSKIKSIYLGNGLWVNSFYISRSFYGNYSYGAQNFPVSNEYSSANIVLTLTETNCSLVGDFYMNNFTINLQNDIETTLYI
ncbi:hypothetical protein TRFO_03719 [Tritrichomonas foetus]|uniref:Uncharacterized protein n=1 Tax=Tritrichomonas foetus TaxID=1144522 RepID=A0A1J4KLC4_9EUKA|nr:hypothetical protein TRFO_03719 [Tritrichomonas foetus]|eukprot:OHT12097.1 hypothetical protein TRFO_03719 [Tritrichomonas foetus]